MKKDNKQAPFRQPDSLMKVIWLLVLGLVICQYSFSQEQKTIYRVSFGKNQFTLSKKNRTQIQVLADSIKVNQNYRVHITGHADSDADSSYNKDLSFKRSMSVKELLIESGVADTVVTVSALGEDQPLVKNTTPFGKAANRRVEIIVLYRLKTAELKIPADTLFPVKNINKECVENDTLVELNDGYKVELSKCDWLKNKECLQVRRRLTYKFTVKENWFRKHIGFKNYAKWTVKDPYYQFTVTSCADSCFGKPVKLYVPQYQAADLDIKKKYEQKNKSGGYSPLSFKKVKKLDSAYYTAEVHCPGTFRCGTDNRCDHPITLKAKNNISILEYSYYTRGSSSYFDSLVVTKPQRTDLLIDNSRHTFFHTLVIAYKSDTITLRNMPIELLDHGLKKIKTQAVIEKRYFLFIPFTKFYTCGHYKKYKIRARDFEALKAFSFPGEE